MKTLFAAVVFAASLSAAINPQIAFTVAVPDAGPVVSDGTFLYVASVHPGAGFIYAVNPATQSVVATEALQESALAVAYNTSQQTLWVLGTDGGILQLDVLSAPALVAGGSPVTQYFVADAVSGPYSISMDEAGQKAWIVGNGVLYEINMNTGAVQGNFASVDGNPIWYAAWSSDTAPFGSVLAVSTYYTVSPGELNGSWEFYSPKSNTWGALNGGNEDTFPSYCGYLTNLGEFWWAPAMYPGAAYNYIPTFTLTKGGTPGFTSYYMVDAYVNSLGFDLWAFSAVAEDPALELFAIVAPIKISPYAGGPEQILETQIMVASANVQYQEGHTPGVSVANAAYVSFGAGYVWASDAMGTVTAISY
jgi:hypothetical protein